MPAGHRLTTPTLRTALTRVSRRWQTDPRHAGAASGQTPPRGSRASRPLPPQPMPHDARERAAMRTPVDEFEFFLEKPWSDGLPVVTPTEARVQRMLTGTRR